MTVFAAVGTSLWCGAAGLVLGGIGAPLVHRWGYRPAADGSAVDAPVLWRVLTVTGAGAGAAGGWALGTSPLLPAGLAALAGVAALAVVDVREHRLRARMLTETFAITAVLVLGAAVVTGEWERVVGGGACSAGAFALFLVLWLVSRGGIGYGDVRLAGVVGLACGAVGPATSARAIVLAFLVGGCVAVVVLARGSGSGHRIAFGPALGLGMLGAFALA